MPDHKKKKNKFKRSHSQRFTNVNRDFNLSASNHAQTQTVNRNIYTFNDYSVHNHYSHQENHEANKYKQNCKREYTDQRNYRTEARHENHQNNNSSHKQETRKTNINQNDTYSTKNNHNKTSYHSEMKTTQEKKSKMERYFMRAARFVSRGVLFFF